MLYSDICIIAAASSASTMLPLATTSAASSRLPAPCADNSVAIACALSTTSKSTSAVKLANIAPSFAPTTRSPKPSLSTVMELASVKKPAGSVPFISAIRPAALSTTSNSISAVNPANCAPIFAVTSEPVPAAFTLTVSTPVTFRTASPAEISAAASSEMSMSLMVPTYPEIP